MVPGFLLLPARPASYMSRSKVAGDIETGFGPSPIGGPPILPPGLSERTMGKDVISTLPKDTDRLLVVHVGPWSNEIVLAPLAVRLLSVLVVLPASSSPFEAGRAAMRE